MKGLFLFALLSVLINQVNAQSALVPIDSMHYDQPGLTIMNVLDHLKLQQANDTV